MFRATVAIFGISLLILLQYGKISGYLYCEFQATVVMNLPDCDCVQLLDGVFEDDDHHPAGISTSKEKLPDYIPQQNFFIPQPSHQIKISGTSSTKPAINSGYTTNIPRPPIS